MEILPTLIARLTAQRDELNVVIGWLEKQPTKRMTPKTQKPAIKHRGRRWSRAQRAQQGRLMKARMKARYAAKRAANTAQEPATIVSTATVYSARSIINCDTPASFASQEMQTKKSSLLET